MKNNIFIFITTFAMLLMSSISISAQTTISGGNVSGTWLKSGSPYKVNGNITVPNGQTLTIEPGVRVEFAQFKSMKVDGRIVAVGGAKTTDSIWFTRQFIHDTSSWKGIKFINTASTNDTSVFKYCVFSYGKSIYDTVFNYRSGGMTIRNFGKIKILNSTFYRNESSIGSSVHITSGGYARVKSCTFKYNKINTFWYWDGSFTTSSGYWGSAIKVDSKGNLRADSCLFYKNVRGKDYRDGSVVLDASTVHVNGGATIVGSAILNHCTFDGNEGYTVQTYGKAYVDLNNCTFTNAPFGKSLALIYAETFPVIKTRNCVFMQNQTNHIYWNESATMYIYNDKIFNNTNYGNISLNMEDPSSRPKYLEMSNVNIYNNQSYNSGISTTDGFVQADKIKNSLIANNYVGNMVSSSNLYNCIVVNNNCRRSAIEFSDFGSLTNCIIWGNKADSAGNRQIAIASGVKSSFKNNIIQNDTNDFVKKMFGANFSKPFLYQNNLSTNPLFVNPTAGVGVGYNASLADFSLTNTCALVSPGIDAGLDSTGLKLPSKDLAGNWRQTGDKIDIGCYESPLEQPIIKITRQPAKDSLCFGSRPARLSLKASGMGLSYQWQKSTNGGANWSNTGSADNDTAIFTGLTPSQNNTLYRVILNGSCDKDTSKTAQVEVYALPSVSIGNDTSLCQGGLVNRTATASAGSLLWHSGNTGATLSQTINKDTIWWLQVTDNKGCKNRDSVKITSKTRPAVNLGADQSLNIHAHTLLDAGAGQSAYLWDDNSTNQTRGIWGSQLGTGQHTIWAEVTSANGCKNRDTVMLNITDNVGISTPIEKVNDIVLYPQPASDYLHIWAPGYSDKLAYRITDMQGRIIQEGYASNGEQISLKAFEGGTYILQLINNNSIIKSLQWARL